MRILAWRIPVAWTCDAGEVGARVEGALLVQPMARRHGAAASGQPVRPGAPHAAD
ncbi:hypothetical protein JYU34_021130 [Plutella xylostella]|uniref:Uncharacterized protein n=1 Tax=Plutella xylostella TaxID=51655 RepID=A0ABQ7PT03_PLUXY|nr:hypothetical protein JYU34_021130 [Plutella xylostella]